MKGATILLFLILIPIALRAGSPGNSGHLVTKEESLGKLLPGAMVETLTTDPNFQRVAYVVKRGDKELAVVDGVEGNEYDDVAEKNEMYFSPDGKRFAYVAKRGDKMLVVTDGQEGKEYDSIYDLFNPIFSPDSKQVAYIATTSNWLTEMLARFGVWSLEDFAVVNGQEGKRYQLVEGLIFSPDSRKLAYIAEASWNRGACVVVNEVAGKQYDGVKEIMFSPDSSRLAYVAHKRIAHQRGTYFAVIDGKEGSEHDSVGGIVFSPDGKHTAYTVGARTRTAENFVVQDDRPGRACSAMPDHGVPVFSPDSQRLAYVTRSGSHWMVIVNERVFDDQHARGYTGNLVFSPDSQHLAYVTRLDDTPTFTGYDCIVVDGVVQEQSKYVFNSPYFSPDGKRLAYLIRPDVKSIPVYGEFQGKEYDKFVTCATSLNTKGMLGELNVPFAFDKDGVLHAIVLKGDELFRLELMIKEK